MYSPSHLLYGGFLSSQNPHSTHPFFRHKSSQSPSNPHETAKFPVQQELARTILAAAKRREIEKKLNRSKIPQVLDWVRSTMFSIYSTAKKKDIQFEEISNGWTNIL